MVLIIILLQKKFNELINDKKFYEHAEIFNNFYGTLKSYVDDIIKKNDILFDIDWQGTRQLSKSKKLKLIKVFLITENKEELKKRLISRNQNSEIEIEERFESFKEDIKKWNEYDYIVINKNLDICFKQLEKIIEINKIKNLIHLI